MNGRAYQTKESHAVDATIISHTADGLLIEADNISALIGEKDLPLIRRGITRPLRDQAHEPIGRGNYAFTRMGNLFVHLKDSPEMVFPPRVWLDRSGIRRVILSPTSQVVAA
jgi:hypothetical protein